MPDPSFPADTDTPSDFDPDDAIERWAEIKRRGHPL